MTVGTLKSVCTTYEFTLEAMQALIANDINQPVEKVDVEYVIEEVGADPMDRYPGVKRVTLIRVRVK
jgi:hypothetical protein